MASSGHILVPGSAVLQDDINFFRELGFRLLTIYPADDPQEATLDGFDMALTLQRDTQGLLVKPTLVIHRASGEPQHHTSPAGCEVRLQRPQEPFPIDVAPQQHMHLLHLREGAHGGCGGEEESSWTVGRAGMLYRDLIPSRLGGAVGASHIRIPDEGEVPDNVHYHDVRFQLIFCIRGHVKLCYEDQGEPFILRAGECVTQPPGIRHRVLASSEMLEVIEVGAQHMTTLDWECDLEATGCRPERVWSGQTFRHFRGCEAGYGDSALHPHMLECDTDIRKASGNVAHVTVLKYKGPVDSIGYITNDVPILMVYVLQGAATLDISSPGDEFSCDGFEPGRHGVTAGSSCTIPLEARYRFLDCSEDLSVLEIRLSGIREP